MLQVIDVPEEPASVIADGNAGLILPVPGTSRNSISLEARDGLEVLSLPAVGLVLIHQGREVLRVVEIDAQVWLTDARLAVACSRYDKGGGWWGDPVSMSIFNAVSKARAAVRSKGKALVGQARYPWIARVGSTPRVGIGSQERLIVDASESDEATYRLIIGLPSSVNAADLAADVVRRAASYFDLKK